MIGASERCLTEEVMDEDPTLRTEHAIRLSRNSKQVAAIRKVEAEPEEHEIEHARLERKRVGSPDMRIHPQTPGVGHGLLGRVDAMNNGASAFRYGRAALTGTASHFQNMPKLHIRKTLEHPQHRVLRPCVLR